MGNVNYWVPDNLNIGESGTRIGNPCNNQVARIICSCNALCYSLVIKLKELGISILGSNNTMLTIHTELSFLTRSC